MKTHIKTAGALMIGVVLGGVSLSTLSAQTKAPAAYWLTEVLELQDQAAFMTAIQAMSPTVQQFGGRYIVLALPWQTLSGTGFPNQFFNDSWVVGFLERPTMVRRVGLEGRAWTLAKAFSESVGS